MQRAFGIKRATIVEGILKNSVCTRCILHTYLCISSDGEDPFGNFQSAKYCKKVSLIFYHIQRVWIDWSTSGAIFTGCLTKEPSIGTKKEIMDQLASCMQSPIRQSPPLQMRFVFSPPAKPILDNAMDRRGMRRMLDIQYIKLVHFIRPKWD